MRVLILGVIGIATQISFAIKFLRNPLTTPRFGSIASSLLQAKKVSESSRLDSAASIVNQSQSDHSENDLKSILSNALALVKMHSTGIQAQGWSAIQESPSFSLYKRQKYPQATEDDTPMEYLMMGEFNDVSPAVLLKMQVEKDSRKAWDSSLRDMQGSMITVDSKKANPVEKCTEDMMYCRSGWPWPLQDRDYVLSRRVKYFDQEGALVLKSKSSQSAKYKPVDKVVRVDSYESRAAFISTHRTNNGSTNDKTTASLVHQPGVKFVTIFCDEQKINISPSILKMVSSQVEKMAKNTMDRLHSVAATVQKTVQDST